MFLPGRQRGLAIYLLLQRERVTSVYLSPQRAVCSATVRNPLSNKAYNVSRKSRPRQSRIPTTVILRLIQIYQSRMQVAADGK